MEAITKLEPRSRGDQIVEKINEIIDFMFSQSEVAKTQATKEPQVKFKTLDERIKEALQEAQSQYRTHRARSKALGLNERTYYRYLDYYNLPRKQKTKIIKLYLKALICSFCCNFGLSINYQGALVEYTRTDTLLRRLVNGSARKLVAKRSTAKERGRT